MFTYFRVIVVHHTVQCNFDPDQKIPLSSSHTHVLVVVISICPRLSGSCIFSVTVLPLIML